MNPARRATPDSEAMASSEDEKPWPSSTTFGNFTMKENSVPGLPGGIWTRKPSFKMSDSAQRNAIRDTARLGAVNPAHSALRPGTTPSPSASEGAGTLQYALPSHPPKIGRSLSHSQGQREAPQLPGQHAAVQPAVLPLGLLTEEDAYDTGSESELGSRLTHTTSHPPIGSLMRTATLPPTFHHAPDSSNGDDYPHDLSLSQPGLLRGRTFESAFASLSMDQPHRRAQWQSHLGWDDVPSVNESRRHSLADIPTRRGSLAGGAPSNLSRTFTNDSIDNNAIEQQAPHYTGASPDRTTADSLTRGQDTTLVNNIPAMYRVPYVALNQDDRDELQLGRREQPPGAAHFYQAGRPKKQLYVVSFKCSRVDVFYLLDNTGLHVREGDLVIVEADRGQDLGTVQHAKVSPDVARLLKKKYSEEQYKWLMMYSRNKDGGFNPNAQLHGEQGAMPQLFPDAPPTMQGTIPRDNFNNLKPKAIKRLANDHEIKMLAEKEGNEAKAKRTCQQKVAHLRLQMEILDAEWQWDFQKLIFYYYADHYINFKDLITELYRIYKTRIWLSAINPASFSQHAMGQPPSGIGPGAVAPFNPYAMNNAYTMAYGEDGDPYGAQMPYRIPYETYTPNYPGIPGVTNSFAPPVFPNGNGYAFYGPNQTSVASTEPRAPSPRNNNLVDYNSFYDRTGANEHRNLGGAANDMTAAPVHSASSGVSADLGQNESMRGPTFGAFAGNGSWNTVPHPTSNAAGVRRPTVPPAPIGTSRPMSHGNDYGVPTAEQRQQAAMDQRQTQFRPVDQDRYTYNRQSMFSNMVNPNSNGDRSGADSVHRQSIGSTATRERQEASASRAHQLDRYLNHLGSPSDMRADDLSRER